MTESALSARLKLHPRPLGPWKGGPGGNHCGKLGEGLAGFIGGGPLLGYFPGCKNSRFFHVFRVDFEIMAPIWEKCTNSDPPREDPQIASKMRPKMTPQMTLGFTGFYSLSGPRPPGGSKKPRKNRCFSIPSGVPRGGVDLNTPKKGVLLGGNFGVILGCPFGGYFWVVFLHKND